MNGRVDSKGKGDSFFLDVVRMIIFFLIIVALSFLVVKYVGQRTQVSGKSMEETLHNGDNLIIDKIAYRFQRPKRFDIIVFPYQFDKNTYYIKRIIGLPGETIQIKGNDIYINSTVLKEHYGKEKMEKNTEGIATVPITLDKDEYFVLGDNRNHSTDSRDSNVGIIHRSSIIGRAWLRLWPLERAGILRHQ